MEDVKIIYEDDDVLVLDKPAGLIVHGDGRTVEPSLADWILLHYPALKDVGEPFEPRLPGTRHQVLAESKNPNLVPSTQHLTPIPRPGIVHRLDRETSGVIIVAKTQTAFTYLKEQFRERNLDKEYRAIVYGHIPTDSGVIDAPIGKSKQDFRLRDASAGAGGTMREAKTVYEVLERLEDKDGHKYSYLRILPKTGRTHQIRAHMRHLGYPVVCDSMYARGRLCPGVLGRHALHALSISFTLPPHTVGQASGEHKTCESPLPADFSQTLEELRRV